MGRGAAKQVRQEVQGLGATQAAEAEKLRTGTLIPGYESAMGGVTPEERGAITTAGMGATAAPFETTQQMAQNQAARTRNTAGIAAQEDALARAKGEAMGGTATDIEKGIADTNFQRKMAGLSGIQQVYGTGVQEAESMYGLTPQLLAQENAPPWWMGLAQSAIGGAGAALTGGVSSGGRWS